MCLATIVVQVFLYNKRVIFLVNIFKFFFINLLSIPILNEKKHIYISKFLIVLISRFKIKLKFFKCKKKNYVLKHTLSNEHPEHKKKKN